MDVTKILEADHEKVAKLFDEIEKADSGERQPLIDDLVTSLRGHMELEETVVYPAMEPVTGKEAVDEGNTEHELARDGIAQMIDLAPDEPGFGAALAAVKAGISHHVDEEENEIFPKLREKGSSVLHDMATPFMEKRMELGMPIQADALDASASKGELLAEAKSAEIDGAASMSKAELADALAARMG